MAFNFARLKNWLGYENITNRDLNAEFNNIVAKAGADTLSSANSTSGSAPTVPAMQTMLNPGGVGTENLALTLQQDIQQLRYQLDAVIGGAQWYSAPPDNLTNLNANFSALSFLPPSRIISGRRSAASSSTDQPMFIVPDGTAATVTLKAASTNFEAYFNGTIETFTSDVVVTGLSVAAASAPGTTVVIDDSSLSGGQATKIQGERGTQINLNSGLIGANVSALQGTFAAFKHSTEYFIAFVDTTNNRLTKCFRGVGFDTNDAWLARTAMSDTDNIVLMKLTWLFATYNSSTPGLALTYNQPTVSYIQPAAPAIGDYWYDITNATWKVYSGTTFVSTTAVFAGICIQDHTGCKAARSADFFKPFNILNTVEIEYLSGTVVQSTAKAQRVSVYGSQYNFDHTLLQWNTATNMDSGLTIGANTTYACYVTDLGNLVISDVYPSERKFDLYGGYHPAKPWRCVGEFSTGGGSTINNDTTLNVTNHYQFVLPNKFISKPQLSSLNQQISSSSGAFSTSSATFTAVTNLSVTITSYGRPIFIGLISDGSTNVASVSGSTNSISDNIYGISLRFLRGTTDIADLQASAVLTTATTNNQIFVPVTSFSHIDPIVAGTYTYTVKITTVDGTGLSRVSWAKLIAYEM